MRQREIYCFGERDAAMKRHLKSLPFPGRRAPTRPRSTQSGVGIVELLVVLVIAGILLTVGMPALRNFYHKHQLQAATGEIRSMVRYARLKALKEKVSHRILFHDENAATPNSYEIQNNEGGPFVTPPQHVHSLPQGVKILGSGPTDSMDILSVGRRGDCNSGKVFIQGNDGALLEVLSIESTCHARVL